jgi:diacylglycerol O-acyltransferase
VSYNGQVNFGLIGDYDAMPDLEDLARDLDWAIAELSEAAPRAKRVRRKHASAMQTARA